ncbi:MAG TPA: hypothetical protein VFJ95_09075 [Gammaproteobacteria bacterium]|jgi:hypothetical protein|nr:hypothetical protein [Gammaproteobacteria bacterium]
MGWKEERRRRRMKSKNLGGGYYRYEFRSILPQRDSSGQLPLDLANAATCFHAEARSRGEA